MGAGECSCKNIPLCTNIRKLLQEANTGIDLGPTLTNRLEGIVFVGSSPAITRLL